ncbi:MAG: hypothetical protein JWN08_3345, partial [Frankiales bacterium]|nr:hypothetical protein [Frankiales bacterium]
MTADGFARWLRGWPDDRLVELVALRVGRAHRLPTSFEQLGGLLAHPAALEPALERLDRTAVQVAVALADAGGCLMAA